MSYGLNRYLCDVLAEMRTCSEMRNYSFLLSLIEEAQTLANRMEASLYDKRDYTSIKKMIAEKKVELKKLEKKIEKKKKKWSPIAQLVEQVAVNHWVAGSSPARGAMLTVAQLVELQIVILVVVSSILVCQPTAPSFSPA